MLSTEWLPHLQPDDSCIFNIVLVPVLVQSVIVFTSAEDDLVYSINVNDNYCHFYGLVGTF